MAITLNLRFGGAQLSRESVISEVVQLQGGMWTRKTTGGTTRLWSGRCYQPYATKNTAKLQE